MEDKNIQATKWVSLHSHGHHSFLDGLKSPKDTVALAKERGQTSVCITDHGNTVSIIPFYKECLDQGLKFIPGCEFYITPENRTYLDKEPQDRKRHHITVLAKNDQGYKNLCKLSTLSFTKGFYYKPRIDLELLKTYKEGLIVLSGCSNSVLSEYLYTDNFDEARRYLKMMKEEFGEDFYGETMVHYLPNFHKYHSEEENYTDKEGNKVFYLKNLYFKHKELCKELGIKRVITDDSHYLVPEDLKVHETAVSIGTAANYNDEDRLTFKDWDLSAQDPDYVEKICKEQDDEELILSSIEIQNKCSFNFKLGEYKFPVFRTPNGETEQEYLRQEVFKGIKRRNYDNYNETKVLSQEIKERIQMELSTIEEMGFSGYLLMVQDSILWAKQHMPVGPGRGSSSGSLVCYLLGITNVDPMIDPKSFLFVRFLNKARISLPDIDTDYAYNRIAMQYFMKRWNSPTSIYEINGKEYDNNQLVILSTGERKFVDELKVGDEIESIL